MTDRIYIAAPEWKRIHNDLKGNGLRVLKEMDKQVMIKKHPQTRYPYGDSFRDKKANDLTKAIIRYIAYRGYQAERISSMGRVVNNVRHVRTETGFTQRIGSVRYIPGTSRNGTADISATIAGRSVKIEVKIGRDRQSEDQRDYEAEVKAAGGIYYIARDFQSFYEWVNGVIDYFIAACL